MQAAAFLPLVLVLIFGFSSTLYVMYHNLFEDYSTILGSLRMFALISLGGHYSLLVGLSTGVAEMNFSRGGCLTGYNSL